MFFKKKIDINIILRDRTITNSPEIETSQLKMGKLLITGLILLVLAQFAFVDSFNQQLGTSDELISSEVFSELEQEAPGSFERLARSRNGRRTGRGRPGRGRPGRGRPGRGGRG